MRVDNENERKGGSTASGIDTTGEDIVNCDKFVENTTKGPQTVTVKVKNTDTGSWVPDIDGDAVSEEEPPAGKTKTYIVNLPAGKSLHAMGPGKYEVVSVS